MILQALYELAERERLIDDPDFEQRPIRFLVTVADGGECLGIQDTNFTPVDDNASGKKAKKAKPQAKVFCVPRDAGFNMRVANDYPGPLFDKREYLFGIAEANYKGAINQERADRRKELFRDRVAEAFAATGDPGVAAVLAFLHRVAEGEMPLLSQDAGPGDLFAFIYAPDIDLLVTERPALRDWWKQQRQNATGDARLQCLVNGEMFSEPELFPKIKRVPGVQGDISLVSFNQTAFTSYGLDSNENAPVSRKSAEAVATALNRLLHPAFPVPAQDPPTLPPRSFRIADDTAFCYWSRGGGEFENMLAGLFEANPESVKAEIWTRLWIGSPPDSTAPKDLGSFYGLVITGQTGRAILRDWFETTVEAARRNVAQHFADLRIVRNAPWKQGEEPPPAIPLWTLLESVAAQGKRENIPSALSGEFVRAAFTGCLYPFGLLTRAVERARAEIGKNEWLDLQRRDARAAIIKAVLNRRNRILNHPEFKELQPTMDAENTHPGYILGALMAVLERLQQAAIGDVNASVVDKHFSGASAAPRATFDRLIRNARHHARKAADGENAGFIFNLERLIDALLIRINVNDRDDRRAGRPVGFPVTLPIEEQGLFVIGYHHMRHWLWMSTEERAAWEAANPTAPTTFLWQTRKLRKNETVTSTPVEA